MTFKDTSRMTEKELDIYESELLLIYEDTFGEGYRMGFFRPDPEVVVADLIRCLKEGKKQVWEEKPLPKGVVI